MNLVGLDLRVNRLFRSMEYAWLKLPENADGLWKDFCERFPALGKKYQSLFKGKLKREAMSEFVYTPSQVREFIIKTILLNLESGFIRHEVGCYVRPVVLRGVSAARSLGVFSLGHQVDFLIAVKPWGKYLGDEAFQKGTPVLVAEEGNEEMNRQHKLACNYLTGQRLVDFAVYNHFSEILLTDSSPERNVLEGSGENLIFYEGGDRFISPAQSGKAILPGTTLKTVEAIIRLTGGILTYRDIPIDEVLSGKFKGAVMTGTAVEVTPISIVYDPKTKRAVEIPLDPEIQKLQKTYLDLAHGLEIDPRLQTLQKELLLELKS